MKRLCTALITLCLFLLGGVTASAATSVTITQDAPGAFSGGAAVVDWSSGAAEQDSAGMSGNASVPVRDAGAGAYPISAEEITENGIAIVKKTYELAPDADPQTLIQEFERDGMSYVCREILRSELPGETLTRQATKTAMNESENDDPAEILLHFPAEILHEQDGYSGRLSLDSSTIKTEANAYEPYSYVTTETREIPGLERNDPSYIEKEWEDMALTDVSFKQGADGLYTATAAYSGTATGQCETGYVTTAIYRGEISMTESGNVRYTVVYEGTPVEPKPIEQEPIPSNPTEPEPPATSPIETASIEEPRTVEAEIGSAPAVSELPDTSNPAPYAVFMIASGVIFLIGAVVIPLYTTKKLKKEREETHETLEEIKRFIRRTD